MSHSTTRATILPEIIRKIMAHDHLSEDEALKAFYSSATGASFADDETGLYGQSPNYVFGLYLEEKHNISSLYERNQIYLNENSVGKECVMKRKVFLAWQSQNRDTARYVRDQLDAAKKDLESCGIDTDIIKTPTQGEPGSPCITDLIWQQIISSDAFIADLSFMPETSCSNSNVMYELGIADALIGENRVILLCDQNTDIAKTAFDINHKRISKVNIKNPSFHVELARWLELCFVEADKQKYIRQYAIDECISELLLLANYFYRYINTNAPNYEHGLNIPQYAEIEDSLRNGTFTAFQAKADFTEVIKYLDEKIAHLMQFFDRKLMWYMISLVSSLKAYQRLCDAVHYRHVATQNREENGCLVDKGTYFLMPGVSETRAEDIIRETVFFKSNTVIYAGNSGLSVYDCRTLGDASKECRTQIVQVNSHKRTTCAKMSTYAFANEWVTPFAIRIENMLQSISNLLMFCGYSLSNKNDQGMPSGILHIQKEHYQKKTNARIEFESDGR